MEITLFYKIISADGNESNLITYRTNWTDVENTVFTSYQASHPDADPALLKDGEVLPADILREILPAWLHQQLQDITDKQHDALNWNHDFEEFIEEDQIYEEEDGYNNSETHDNPDSVSEAETDRISLIGFVI